MKKILVLCLMIFLITGCGKKNDNVVNVLNWSSYIPDEVIHEFEKETGIKVNYSTYSSNEELLAKVTSVKKGTYDLVFPSDYMVEIMKSKKLLTKLDRTKLGNINNLDINFLGKDYDKDNEYSLPFLAAMVLIAYDSSVIKDEITGYNDLLNPKYKENIVLLDDQRTMIGIALLALGYDINETESNKLNEAKNFLLKLKDNIKLFDSDSPKNFLISDEVDIGVIWNAEIALAMNENKDIKVVYPKEGAIISLDNYVILNGAQNEDNAYKLIDYLLRADVMKKIIESYPYTNVNGMTKYYLDESYLHNKAANVDYEVIKKASFVGNIGKMVKRFDEIWAEIK